MKTTMRMNVKTQTMVPTANHQSTRGTVRRGEARRGWAVNGEAGMGLDRRGEAFTLTKERDA